MQIFYFYITIFCLYRYICMSTCINVYVILYCDACFCAGPPGEQPLAEGDTLLKLK